jgi:signal transduction histidine kinase
MTGIPRPPRTARPRTVRTRIATLLAGPLIALLALWGHTAVTAAQQLDADRRQQRAESGTLAPALAAAHALQDERRAAATYLARPDRRAADALETAAERTRRATGALPADAEPVARRLTALDGLRTRLTAGRGGWPEAYAGYTAAVEETLRTADAAPVAGRAPEPAWAEEYLARQDALLLAAHHAAAFDAGRHREFAAAAAGRRALETVAAGALDAPARERLAALSAGTGRTAVSTVERAVLEAAPGTAAALAATEGWERWQSGYPRLRDGLREVQRADAAGERAPTALGVSARTAAPAGLAAIVLAVAVSAVAGRALVADLAALRAAALEIARRKLPQALRRIRSGGAVDIAAEAPELPLAHDEIGQVRQALGIVHRSALRAAEERAELSDGVSRALVNLARRSQALVGRQLELLDEMERTTEDPGKLAELFRLDHLSTRMRRQAESLLILSGAEPGRSWGRPVPLTSVVQAAVCEIEDYRRVELRRLPDVALAGHAVADLTHLLAELLENATRFSPAHTWVRVTAQYTEDGYLCEIEDAGCGLRSPELAHANRRLGQSDAQDLGSTDRLGLFVVGRLAARHGISVRLRDQLSAGLTATVLVPSPLLSTVPPGWAEPPPGDGADGGPAGPEEHGGVRGMTGMTYSA